MADHGGKRGASFALLGLSLAVGWLFLRAPSLNVAAALPMSDGPGPVRTYHGERPDPISAGSCSACHGSAPHSRAPRSRAFLNLHTRSLACGVCHLTGEGLVVQRLAALRPGEAEGPIALGRTVDGRWQPASMSDQGIQLRSSGQSCADCHRRGSPLLSSGLFDDYRRRILEELELLYRLGRAGL